MKCFILAALLLVSACGHDDSPAPWKRGTGNSWPTEPEKSNEPDEPKSPSPTKSGPVAPPWQSTSIDSVAIKGQFAVGTKVIRAGNINLLSAEVKGVTATPKLNDQLKISQVTADNIISPDLSRCELTDNFFSHSGGRILIQWSGEGANCTDFLTSVLSKGVKLQFKNAALLNGEKIAKVEFEIAAVP